MKECRRLVAGTPLTVIRLNQPTSAPTTFI